MIGPDCRSSLVRVCKDPFGCDPAHIVEIKSERTTRSCPASTLDRRRRRIAPAIRRSTAGRIMVAAVALVAGAPDRNRTANSFRRTLEDGRLRRSFRAGGHHARWRNWNHRGASAGVAPIRRSSESSRVPWIGRRKRLSRPTSDPVEKRTNSSRTATCTASACETTLRPTPTPFHPRRRRALGASLASPLRISHRSPSPVASASQAQHGSQPPLSRAFRLACIPDPPGIEPRPRRA